MEILHLALLLWVGLVFWVLGQIWFVQIVIYPLFALVGEADYLHNQRFHSKHILFPIILPGFAGFVLPLALAFLAPPSLPVWLIGANIAVGLVSFLDTVLLEIPRHVRLTRAGKSPQVIGELIRYNWPRTISITIQAILAIWMLYYTFSPT